MHSFFNKLIIPTQLNSLTSIKRTPLDFSAGVLL
nr:MAG TPA: hypothetical protein [Caudoviricetes sp.]